MTSVLDAYYDAVFDTDREAALEVVDRALDAGATPESIVFDIVLPSLDRMLEALTRDFDATLAQHYLAAQIAVDVTERMIPRFAVQPEVPGTVVLGTASGDFHGLGKKIVAGCLSAHMVRVVDLGLSVSPERFVDAALAEGARVIGVSSMMLHTATGAQGPRAVRRILDERGLSGRITLAVGGAPYRFDDALCAAVGADLWATNGVEAAHRIAALLRRPEALP